MRTLNIVLLIACICSLVPAAELIWIEGEDAKRHTFKTHSWYFDVTKTGLSGNNAINNYQNDAEAHYEFTAASKGDFHFWIRANPVAGPKMEYNLNGAGWKNINFGQPIDNTNIASNGAPDMRFIAWINIGSAKLKKGNNEVSFRINGGNQKHGYIDCFVFSGGPFVPNGSAKPGQRTGKANPGFFAWEPAPDDFNKSALIDLSFLNEDVAGEKGPVSRKGNDFILGNGKKVKFWAANAGPAICALDHASHIYLAKNLAKRGINMVRLHGGIYDQNNPAVSMKRIDHLHHLIHALKQEGIYTKLSIYFPAWFRLNDHFYNNQKWPVTLLFYDKQMQGYYFKWCETLFKTKNPYTGIPLAKDPAVAIFEIQNEDSQFFWTFGEKSVAPERWQAYSKMFGSWCKKKYGSIDKAYAAWNGAKHAKDKPAEGVIHLGGAWEMTRKGSDQNANKRKRINDQVAFLTENMREFYQMAIKKINGYGYKGMISCGNWHTADSTTLDALERYCYTAGDVIDHHGYFDHNHKGQFASWSVRPGDTFTSQSALKFTHGNPLPYVETDGHPHIISEIGWPAPNAYRSEFTFLNSCYLSLQGCDGIFNFAIGSPAWDNSLAKFPLNTPVTLACFPAAALVYRNQYVQEAETIVMDNLNIKEQMALKGTAVNVKPALDQFRAKQIPGGKKQEGKVDAIDPMSFYVGRVARNFEGKPEKSYQKGINEFIDRSNKTITSITGELMWDYGTGVATMNTPKAQGACGFLKAKGSIALDNLTINSNNAYANISLVAMDNKDIATSKKLLLQVMTIEQPYNFKTSSGDGMGGSIQNMGGAPFGIKKFSGSVTLKLKGAKPKSVTACDENGYAFEGKKVNNSGSGSKFKIDLNEDVVYYVIQR